LGKAYENLMVDLRATNAKLWDRGARIVATLTGLSRDDAMELLKKADGCVKVAVVMHKKSVSSADAEKILARCNGVLRHALEG
jgi:N-acetylmuramic acid 6-phosphate etherase